MNIGTGDGRNVASKNGDHESMSLFPPHPPLQCCREEKYPLCVQGGRLKGRYVASRYPVFLNIEMGGAGGQRSSFFFPPTRLCSSSSYPRFLLATFLPSPVWYLFLFMPHIFVWSCLPAQPCAILDCVSPIRCHPCLRPHVLVRAFTSCDIHLLLFVVTTTFEFLLYSSRKRGLPWW